MRARQEVFGVAVQRPIPVKTLNHIQPSGYDGAIQVPYGSLKKRNLTGSLHAKTRGCLQYPTLIIGISNGYRVVREKRE